MRIADHRFYCAQADRLHFMELVGGIGTALGLSAACIRPASSGLAERQVDRVGDPEKIYYEKRRIK